MIKIFSPEKYLWNKYSTLISSINQIEKDLVILSNEQFKIRARELQAAVALNNYKQDPKLIAESFALVREASKRTLSLRHYDTQILGGLVLNEGRIAEMRTGEGKTLVGTGPAVTNALSKKGVHMVTVNDYLAQRDAETMGQIYRFLGLSVGLINSNMKPATRKINYNRDITYVTNSELGFDFLKDNLTTNINEITQRPFNYCIIDEVDSILIDEARTPLIISSPEDVELKKIVIANEVVKFLEETKHFEVDEKTKSVSLTNSGNEKVQKLLKVNNLYNVEDPWIPFILNALKAKRLFIRDKNYILENNEVIIVDDFTGRSMPGRKWSDGLHAAVEVKENIYNPEGSKTTASITYQNFFRLYPKLAGMTGTAKTEELEFETIYNLSVEVLPTHKPIQRRDLPDVVYIDELSKWRAVILECQRMYEVGRPVLVGTTNIQTSEALSKMLKAIELPHQLLNAKPENVKRESDIVAQAGCLNTITIATNMAGRGTDIILGGNPEFKASSELVSILKNIIDDKTPTTIKDEKLTLILNRIIKNKWVLENFRLNLDGLVNLINIPNRELNKFESVISQLYLFLLNYFRIECVNEREQVKNLGGLYVIGTERNEARRIDNQLRGRAGRQGDPGTSRFFLSLNDHLLKVFGGDRIKNFMQTFQLTDEAIESNFLSQSLDTAQQKVEGFYYDQRKTLNKYDRILDEQRSLIYRIRKGILFAQSNRELILQLSEGMVGGLIGYLNFIKSKDKQKFSRACEQASYYFNKLNISFYLKEFENLNNLQLVRSQLYKELWVLYALIELEFWLFDIELFRRYEKLVILNRIDQAWSSHLESMAFLKDSVTWEGFGQKDPILRYQLEANRALSREFAKCRNDIIITLLLGSVC